MFVQAGRRDSRAWPTYGSVTCTRPKTSFIPTQADATLRLSCQRRGVQQNARLVHSSSRGLCDSKLHTTIFQGLQTGTALPIEYTIHTQGDRLTLPVRGHLYASGVFSFGARLLATSSAYRVSRIGSPADSGSLSASGLVLDPTFSLPLVLWIQTPAAVACARNRPERLGPDLYPYLATIYRLTCSTSLLGKTTHHHFFHTTKCLQVWVA